jgi:hypothetical protein
LGEGGKTIFTLKEKIYLLKALKAMQRWSFKKKDPLHDSLVEKLEQMIRNEQVNKEHL